MSQLDRAYIAKGRVAEMRSLGWTLVDTMAGDEDGEWSVLMEGPALEAPGFISLGEAVKSAIGLAEEAWRAHG